MTNREAYGAIQDGADLLSPDPITALAGPADREWPKQDAADWGRRRGALGVQKPNPYLEGTPGHRAYQQAYDEAAAERAAYQADRDKADEAWWFNVTDAVDRAIAAT